jgi:TRAP-type uncharacterized transport system fused permease subunit
MKRKHVYLLLCLAGTILPYWQLVPWLSEHGLDIPLFFNQLFANRISAFFGADVFVSAAVVFVFVAFERVRLGSKWWLPAVAVLIVGVSLGLPLLLYLREDGTEPAISDAS